MMRVLPKLAVCGLLACVATSFGQALSPPSETQTNFVTATRTNLALVTPAPGPIPQSPMFSERPTTAEIKRARVFDEPLVPSPASRSYEWDEENRLLAVVEGNIRTEFVYNAIGQCLSVIDKTGGSIDVTHRLTWSGDVLAEEVLIYPPNTGCYKWYYDEAYYNHYVSGPFYFTHDHLGSIRDAYHDGNNYSQYVYDPVGRRTTVVDFFAQFAIDKNQAPVLGFTGLYTVARHNLVAATHRIYDPDLGRWISRDPIGEAGGLNLYRYADNNPINQTDPDGLCAQQGGIFGEGQFRDPNTGLLRDIAGNRLGQLNRLTPTGFNASRGSRSRPFDIVPYGRKAPGYQKHHAILDKWASENVPGYEKYGSETPTVVLARTQHAATKKVYRDWLEGLTGKRVGGSPDWKNLPAGEMQSLTEKMFDAARVPESVRIEYYRAFHRYIYRQ